MQHPELVYKAANKARIPVLTLMYDAFCFDERAVSRKVLWNVYCEFAHGNGVPQFIEDYAVQVLAGNAVRLDGVATINMQRR